jgi:DNA-binding transcriptional regulator YdaS (Cro superfamily)
MFDVPSPNRPVLSIENVHVERRMVRVGDEDKAAGFLLTHDVLLSRVIMGVKRTSLRHCEAFPLS